MITPEEQHCHQEEIFDKEYSSLKDYLLNWRRSYLRRLFKYLKLKKPGRFLDIGAGGSGYMVIEVAKRGIDAYGIDISQEAIRKAIGFAKKALSKKTIKKCHFKRAKAEDLPYPDKFFDKIACIAVLEHVVDDEKAIKECSRVLKEDGLLFLTVPNRFQSRLSLFRIFNNDKQAGHLKRYDKKKLVKLASKHNFILENSFYHGHYIKIFQHLLEIAFPPFLRKESKLWRFIDNLDLADGKNSNSYHITLILKKVNTSSN